jgi:hypothetical protein
VQPQLKSNDQWSIFYGVFDKKYLELEYVLYGSIEVAFSPAEKAPWQLVEAMGPAIQAQSQLELKTQLISFESLGVFALASVGLSPREEDQDLARCLSKIENRDVHEMRNHIFLSSLGLKSGDIPNRDQTAIVMQVKERAIRLAKPT